MRFFTNLRQPAHASAGLWASHVEWMNATAHHRCVQRFTTDWKGSFNCTRAQCLSGTVLQPSAPTAAAMCHQGCCSQECAAGAASGAKSCQHDLLSALVHGEHAAPQHIWPEVCLLLAWLRKGVLAKSAC